MKKAILLIFILQISIRSYGENPNIQWSEEFKKKTSENSGSVLSADENFIYVSTAFCGIYSRTKMTDCKVNPGIIKFDRSYKIVKENTYGTFKNVSEYIDIIPIGNYFILITAKFDLKTWIKYYYAQKIEKLNLMPEGKPILLLSTEQRWESNYFKYSFSPDSSKFIFYAPTDLKHDDNEQIKFNVFDKDLAVIYSIDENLHHEKRKFTNPFFAINNSGTVALVEFPKVSNKPKKEADYDMTIIGYSNGTHLSDKNVLVERNKILSHYGIKANSNGEFYIIYSCKEPEDKIVNEINVIKVNQEANNLVGNKINTIDQKTALRIEETRGKFEVEMTDLFDPLIQNIHFEENGDATIVIEHNYESSPDKFSSKLIVCRINKDGNLLWTRVVPRNVWGVDFRFHLYAAILSLDNKVMIFYNDYPENNKTLTSENAKPKETFNCKKMSICLTQVDKSGKFDWTEIGSYENIAFSLYSRGCKQVSPNEYILFGWNPFEISFKIGSLKIP